MTQIAEKIFNLSDLNAKDKLYKVKKDSIEKLKELFTSNMNKARSNDDWWTREGYYVEWVGLEDYHLAHVFEEKKAFINWFLKEYPKFNVPYDPKNLWKTKRIIPSDTLLVRPAQIARERDLLFGTNGVEAVTVNNWRERIRDASTKEEVESIAGLLNSKWTMDNFVRNVKIYIDLFCQSMQNLTSEMRLPVAPKYPDKHKRYFKADGTYGITFKGALRLLESKMENNPNNSECWGSQSGLNKFHHKAGLNWSYLAARDLIKPELEKVLKKAKETAQKNGVSHDWKSFPTSEKKPEPVPTPPTPDKPPQSDPNDSGYESDLDPAVEEVAQKKIEEIKNKLKKASEEAQNLKPDDSPNPENKTPTSPKKKEEIKAKIAQLEKEAKDLEGKDNGIASTIFAELKGQIEILRKQVEDLKKSLKEILESAKDYARKLFSYFQKEKIKQITFEEDGSAAVEYEDNHSKVFAAPEVDNHQELKELKEQVQQSEQKTLSRQELSQIVGSTSSPTSTEQKHWEKYKYYYFAGIGIGLLVIGGLIVYWWMKKEQKEVE